MSGKSPWSVKGVSAEDREAAKIAARKAGMPIGVWLSEQIRLAASDKPAPEPADMAEPETRMAPEPEHDAPHPGTGGGSRERHRGGQVDPRFAFGRGQWSVAEEAVDSGMVATASAGYPWQFRGHAQAAPPAVAHAPMPANTSYAPPVPQMRHPVPAPVQPGLSQPEGDALVKRVESLEGRLEDLASRIDAVEERTLSRFEPVLGKIEALTAEVDELNARPAALPASDEAAFSTAPIERAVMRLSERLGRVERRVMPGQKSGGGFFSRLFRRG
ncbi:hypothetical protein NUH88_11095 [Nisaea acidiphila]|uniref:Localization factor PodJL n=1 Tax=Nisaea acidiphila TaxID=1862145 RepID=A0A9J7ARM7_9PROT|nr:hypothetical protein [Nisaea acidiphila]UUX47965.1 hypothetical protein NUH88_11095 [Nisaea acidiphila]